MEKHPECGITGGKIFLKSNPKKVISSGYMMNNWTGNILPASGANKNKEPDWVQGCAMLIPKNVIEKIGVLDEGFSIAYFEDFDLCLRAKKAGYKINYLPEAIFLHGESTTANKNLPIKYQNWYKSKIRFVLKNLPLLNIISILSLQILVFTPYRLLILRDKRFTPFIKGLAWNISHISQTISMR